MQRINSRTCAIPIIVIISAVLLFTSCESQKSNNDSGYTVDFIAMDAPMKITAYGDNAKDAVGKAQSLVLNIDKNTNIYNENSQVARLNSNGLFENADPSVPELLTRGMQLSESSEGSFNILIRPISALWNIGHDDARIPSEEELTRALATIDSTNIVFNGKSISLKNNAAVDIGGIAKGYAADKITGLFHDMKIENALVSLSGNIYALGKNEDGEDWQIGLQDPLGETPIIGVIFASDKSVVTSGLYERYSDIDGIRYGHIFDPSTGLPVENDLLSVTIISKDSTLADAYSTALFVMGLDDALNFQSKHSKQFDAILVTKDKEIYCTAGVIDKFEIADKTGRYIMSVN